MDERLRLAVKLMAQIHKDGPFRIKIHVTKVNADGKEVDLGPWPDVVAQVSRFEDAADLCSFLTHHWRHVLFPRVRLD